MIRRTTVRGLWWPALVGLVLLPAAAPGRADTAADYEHRLISVLEGIQQAKLDNALQQARAFVRDYPRSRVGKLVYGDLLASLTTPVIEPGGAIGRGHDEKIRGLQEELALRWRHRRGGSPAHAGLVPASLLEFGNHRQVLFVDLEQSRLYVFANQQGTPRLARDYYVTIGKQGSGKQREGDQRTPIGVYRVTAHIDGDRLPDLYGSGAFPIDYPNVMDRRRKRTGSGIWLHGSPSDTYSREPKASDGCLVLSNPDLRSLSRFLDPYEGVPVVIAQDVNWVSADQMQTSRRHMLQQLELWRRDWESLDTDRYLSHYSTREFASKKGDFKRWAVYKRRINARKRFIRVRVSNVDAFRYPGEPETVVVNFDQDYRSDNYHNTVRKQQYWKRDGDGSWRIIYEG